MKKIIIINLIILILLILSWITYLVFIPKMKRIEIEIPNVGNFKEDEAYNYLKKLGLKVSVNSIDEDIPCYTVPKMGTKVYKGSIVYLYAYKKVKKNYEMQKGKIYSDEIKEYIEGLGYSLEIKYEISSNLSGIILDEDIKDNIVILTIAKKHDDLMFKNYRGYDLYRLNREMYEYKLNVCYIFEVSPFPFGYVLGQNVRENTIIGYESPYEIRFEISKGLY